MALTAGPMTSVVLARGLGRRMREADEETALGDAQQRAAAAGQKGMMPVGGSGRPFLDYVISALSEAGAGDVILVVSPDHAAIAAHYTLERLAHVDVRFAVQPEATGTAHAVLAAEALVGDRPFLVLNADNLYPVGVLRSLVALDGPGLAGFERARLVDESGFPEARVAQFAVLDADAGGWLRGIREKPGPDDPAAQDPRALISMNVWRFDARIFDACRSVPRSSRGEYELPEAVGVAVERGVRFRVLPARGAVLDLSRRADIAGVSDRLAGREPHL